MWILTLSFSALSLKGTSVHLNYSKTSAGWNYRCRLDPQSLNSEMVLVGTLLRIRCKNIKSTNTDIWAEHSPDVPKYSPNFGQNSGNSPWSKGNILDISPWRVRGETRTTHPESSFRKSLGSVLFCMSAALKAGIHTLGVVFPTFWLSIIPACLTESNSLKLIKNWLKLVEADWNWLKMTETRSKWIESRRESEGRLLSVGA